jgi:PKD repeat protein
LPIVFLFPLAACEQVPLLAPAGSSITLTASTNALPLNGTTQIIVQVLEPSGTPPHSGTHVIFTTTLGRIEPSEVETDVSGRAVVTFNAGNASGTATISAASGGAQVAAEASLKIAVGAAAVGRVTVSANPASVSALGGSTTVTATVLDVNGNILPSAPVSFTTTAGTLSVEFVSTDQSGVARTVLTTSLEATVTASVGAQGGSGGTGGGMDGETGGTTGGQASGSVTVKITASPTLVITPPSTAPSVNLPASFTFVVTAAAQNGAAVRSVTVDWGDGSTQDLGAINGTAVVSHVYRSIGTFTIKATVTDAAGISNTVSTSVTVIPIARPTLILNYSPIPAKVNTTTTINIQVTVPQGISVQDVTVNFGDGSSTDIGGASSANVPHVYTATGTFTVTVTVTDSVNQQTVGNLSVSVGP